MAQKVEITVEGDQLVIRADVSKEAIEKAEPSKSGQTYIIATSGGNKEVELPDGSIFVGVNVYCKK